MTMTRTLSVIWMAALAVAAREASTPEFKQYAARIVENAKALGEALAEPQRTRAEIMFLQVRDGRECGRAGQRVTAEGRAV